MNSTGLGVGVLPSFKSPLLWGALKVSQKANQIQR